MFTMHILLFFLILFILSFFFQVGNIGLKTDYINWQYIGKLLTQYSPEQLNDLGSYYSQ